MPSTGIAKAIGKCTRTRHTSIADLNKVMVDACGAILPRVSSANIRDFARATSIIVTYTARVSHVTGTREGTARAHVARPIEKVIPKGTFSTLRVKPSFTGTCIVANVGNPTLVTDTGKSNKGVKYILEVTSIVRSNVSIPCTDALGILSVKSQRFDASWTVISFFT